MKVFAFTLALVGTVLFGACRTQACSCGWVYQKPTPLMADGSPVPSMSEFENQPFLFLGTVESIRPILTGSPEMDAMFASGSATVIRLEHVWRGELLFDTIAVFTGFPGGGCGYPFRVGRCYLVFAGVDSDGLLRTSICTRTAPLEQARELLSYLYTCLGRPHLSIEEILQGAD